MLFYRLLMGAFAPFLVAATLVQRLRGRVAGGAVWQRLGVSAGPTGSESLWLHAASNGEVTSARGILLEILQTRPDLSVLVTANTGTAVALVKSWELPGVQAALAPLDSLGSAGRVFRRWRPAALVVVENELWPARLAAADKAGVPVAVIGARMSARSAQRWVRFAPHLMRRTLQRVTFLSAQDQGSAARLVDLGLPVARLGPVVMLKAQVAVSMSPALPQVVPRDRVLLAASTHPGEEAMIVQAFAKTRARFDLLIIAPRHPRRSAEVAGVITAAGFAFARRSDGAAPQAGVPVFLADTLGEMALWYRMSGVTVIGGSFAPLGGHTPYEPAAFGSAILHGPHMENFAAPVAALAQMRGALATDRAGLGLALAGLEKAQQTAMAAAARSALPPEDATDALAQRLLAMVRRA